jgi:hypothetical protein
VHKLSYHSQEDRIPSIRRRTLCGQIIDNQHDRLVADSFWRISFEGRGVTTNAECFTLSLTADPTHSSSACASAVMTSSPHRFHSSTAFEICSRSREHHSTRTNALVGAMPGFEASAFRICTKAARCSWPEGFENIVRRQLCTACREERSLYKE